MGVRQQHSGLIIFVASKRPPIPVSKTAQSTLACLKHKKENNVSNSNQVPSRSPGRS